MLCALFIAAIVLRRWRWEYCFVHPVACMPEAAAALARCSACASAACWLSAATSTPQKVSPAPVVSTTCTV